MTSPNGGLQIQFPVPAGAGTQLAIPPQPAGQADQFMIQVASSPATRQQLIARDLLAGESLANAQTLAAQLYPQMLANTQIFMEFGKEAIAGMNTLIDQMLREVEPVDIPELTTMMRDLNNDMRKIRGKYDLSDPRTREKVEKWANGVRGWFGRQKSLIEALMEDAMSLEQQLDRVKGRLSDKSTQLIRNVHLYDQLYATNEREIMNVIGTIAVMELIRDLATREAAEIVVDSNNPADRTRAERKRVVAEFVNGMDIKIAEYKNRLFVGWTTSPQVTNMRTLDVGLAQKLDLLLNLTIPVMKGTILQWRMMIQTQQGAMMERVVAEAANEWLTAYANAGAQVVPMIAESIQTPTLTPQTITAMATSIEQQAQGIVDAYETGKERRAEVDDAIVTAQRVIQNATGQVSSAVVDELVSNATRRLELPTP